MNTGNEIQQRNPYGILDDKTWGSTQQLLGR